MKNFILVFLFFIFSNQLFSHGVQVVYEVKNNGSVRIWIEHWHGPGLEVNSFPLEVEYYQNDTLLSSEVYLADGKADQTPISELPFDTEHFILSTCGDADTYNDWVYWDFFPIVCDQVIDIVIVEGLDATTDEGCSELYPQTITRDFTDIYPPSLSIDTLFLNPTTDCTGEFLSNLPVDVLIDNCDPDPTVSFSPEIGSFFPLGTSTVYVTATDYNGNTSNDSIIILVEPIKTHEYEVAIESFEWRGFSFNESGVYTDTISTTNSCDSVVSLDLIIFEDPYKNIPDAICFDDIGTDFDLAGDLSPFGEGIINDSTFSTIGFTDSIYNLTAYVPGYDENGLNFDRYQSNLNDNFNYIDIDNVADTVFEMYDSNNFMSQKLPIGFEFSFFNQTFDSLSVTYLGILELDSYNQIVFADYYQLRSDTLSGAYKFATLGSSPERIFVFEFDSVYSIINSDTLYTQAQIHLLEGSNTIEYHTKHMNYMPIGNPSIVQYILSYSPADNNYFEYFIPGRSWNFNWHMASNDFASFNPSTTINKTFEVFSNIPDTTLLTITNCDSFEYNATTYTESGLYTDTIIEFGCVREIISIDLTLNYSSSSNQNFTFNYLEDSVVVGNNVYYDSGIYSDTLINSSGCDSIITTELVVYYFTDSIQNITICEGESIAINNNLYNAQGQYVDTLQIEGQPDVILTTNLLVNPTPNVPTIEQYWSSTFKTDDDILCQWYLNGEILEDETSQFLNFYVGGVYTVESINEFGCKSMSEGFIIGNLNRSVITELDFVIYPNPTSNILNIELNKELGTNFKIEVLDMTGRLVFLFDGEKHNTLLPVINLNNLNKGSYSVSVKYKDGLTLNKLIIKQ